MVFTKKEYDLKMKDIGSIQRIPDGVIPNRASKLVQTDHPDYEKDLNTGAVLNKNMGEYEEFKAKRERGKEFLQLKNDIETLKSEVAWLRGKINQ